MIKQKIGNKDLEIEKILEKDKEEVRKFIFRMSNYFKGEIFLDNKFEPIKIIKKDKEQNKEFLKIYDFVLRLSRKYNIQNPDNFFQDIKYFASCVNQLLMVIVYVLKLHKDLTIDPLFEKIKKNYEYNPQQNPFLLSSWVFQMSFLEGTWKYNKGDFLSKNMQEINNLMQSINGKFESISEKEKSEIREWINKNKNQVLNYFLSEKFIRLLPEFNNQDKMLMQEIIKIIDRLLFNLPLLKILKIYKFSDKGYRDSVYDTIENINKLTLKTSSFVDETSKAIAVAKETAKAVTDMAKSAKKTANQAEKTTKKINYVLSPSEWSLNPMNWFNRSTIK